jgi:dTDP-4-amino-4,6-dideoxygalactose transaminase
LEKLKENNINAVFHYVPLHSSPAGKRLGKVSGDMKNTDLLSENLIRLPLWIGLNEETQICIFDILKKLLTSGLK